MRPLQQGIRVFPSPARAHHDTTIFSLFACLFVFSFASLRFVILIAFVSIRFVFGCSALCVRFVFFLFACFFFK